MADLAAMAPWAGLLAPPGLVGFFFWLVWTGKMVPRKTHDDIIHDRDEWRAAHRISESQRIETARQVTQLLEVGKTVDQIMWALVRPSDRTDE